ncbi:hypothetical protein BG003_003729 [Podila horticola]|nr:hypothetical protein BG003_003729 [Podila horticola]
MATPLTTMPIDTRDQIPKLIRAIMTAHIPTREAEDSVRTSHEPGRDMRGAEAGVEAAAPQEGEIGVAAGAAGPGAGAGTEPVLAGLGKGAETQKQESTTDPSTSEKEQERQSRQGPQKQESKHK